MENFKIIKIEKTKIKTRIENIIYRQMKINLINCLDRHCQKVIWVIQNE